MDWKEEQLNILKKIEKGGKNERKPYESTENQRNISSDLGS